MNVRDAMPHEQAAELLPWLVNGSLASSERDDLLEHTKNCVICRRELKGLQRLRDSIAHVSDDAPIPAPDMRRINARIDALIERENRPRLMIARLRELVGTPWRIAFAAQTLLLVALGGALLWPDPDEGEFVTLTAPESLPRG